MERDPYGIAQHSSGAKLDQGKNRLSLVFGGFARSLTAVGQVGTYGANKYTANGWIDVPCGFDRYTDAMFRHYSAEARGELYDMDTKLLHAAHLAWNALARLDLLIRQMEKDEDTISKGEGKELTEVGEGIFDSLSGNSPAGYREQVNGLWGGGPYSCEGSKTGLSIQRGMQEPGKGKPLGSLRSGKCKCRSVGTNCVPKEESQEASGAAGRPLLPGDDWEEG